MRKLYWVLFFLLNISIANAAEIKVGDSARDFRALDDQGNIVTLKDFRGKAVVLYFYPKDDTPGCTVEAQNFRDHYSEFQNLDTVILGVSGDSVESHQAFKRKHQIPFPLLVDKDHKIARAYDVPITLFPSRDVVMIDNQGKVVKILRNVNPQTVVGVLLQDAK